MTYAEKLNSPRWWWIRDEILERDGRKCQECRSEVDLQVHHKWYEGGRDPWDYPLSALLTLCEVCHTRRHTALRAIQFLLGEMTVRELGTARMLLAEAKNSREEGLCPKDS